MAYELVVFEAEFVELGFVGGIIFGGAGGLSDDEAAADGHAFVALPARAAYTVFSAFVTAWFFAMWPTMRRFVSVIATIDGVVLYPPLFSITSGPFSPMIATQEFVVPRSIPMTFSPIRRPPSEFAGTERREDAVDP